MSATDIAAFALCPRYFLLKRVYGIRGARVRKGAAEHVRRYREAAEKSVKMDLGQAVVLASQGEHLWGAEVEVAGNGVYGVVDALELTPRGATVIEYKHSLYPGARIQALAYAYALSRIWSGRIVASIRETRSERVLWEKEVRVEDLNLVARVRDALHRAVMEGSLPARPGEHCALCPATAACPFKKAPPEIV